MPYRTTLNGVDYLFSVAPTREGSYASLTVLRGAQVVGLAGKAFTIQADQPEPALQDMVRELWRQGMRDDDGRPVYLDPHARDRLVSAVLEPIE